MPDHVVLPEFTWSAVLVGAVLGIVFGALSLYLVLKVGMTVSASIPVAVLSITLFRIFSRVFGFRRASILENNIVQTTGSAGESIAFGVGVTMPAVMILGFEMEITPRDGRFRAGRIAGHPDDDPLAKGVHRQAARKADLSRRHRLRRRADYRRDGRGHRQNGLRRLRHRLCLPVPHAAACSLWKDMVSRPLAGSRAPRPRWRPTPRCWAWAISSARGFPASWWPAAFCPGCALPGHRVLRRGAHRAACAVGEALIRDMDADQTSRLYVLYIGAGAVAAGGIISLFRALPLILGFDRRRIPRHAFVDSGAAGGQSAAPTATCPCGSSFSASLLLVLAIWAFLDVDPQAGGRWSLAAVFNGSIWRPPC